MPLIRIETHPARAGWMRLRAANRALLGDVRAEHLWSRLHALQGLRQ